MVMVFIGKAGEQAIAALRKPGSKDSGFFLISPISPISLISLIGLINLIYFV